MFNSIEELKREIEQYEENMNSTNGIINLLNKNIEALATYDEKIEELQTRYEKAAEGIDVFQGKVDSIIFREDKVKEEIDSIKTRMEALSNLQLNAVASIDPSLDEIKLQLSQLVNQNKEIEDKIAITQQKVERQIVENTEPLMSWVKASVAISIVAVVIAFICFFI